MPVAKKLAVIAAGYGLSVIGGIAAVAVHEWLTPDDVQQTSGGMVAFGDMVVFVLAAGLLGLAPTWFLLRLSIDKAPRAVLAAVLLIAALGPVSWLAVTALPTGVGDHALSRPFAAVPGAVIAFAAMPRIVLGPVLLLVEAAAFVLIRARLARALMAGAMTMDIVPLGMFALHMIAATHR